MAWAHRLTRRLQLPAAPGLRKPLDLCAGQDRGTFTIVLPPGDSAAAETRFVSRTPPRAYERLPSTSRQERI